MKDHFTELDSAKNNAKIEKERAKVHDRDIRDLRKMLKRPECRRFLWGVISLVFERTFNVNAKIGDYRTGRQSLAQDILDDVNEADPMIFAQMQQEAISEQKSKAALKQVKEEEDGR